MNQHQHNMFVTLGASNHSDGVREQNDFYATDPKAVRLLLEREQFSPTVWECACGQGHLSDELARGGYKVFSSDLIDRGYEKTEIIDFLKYDKPNEMDIVTNPPYKYALEFIENALRISNDETKIAMFLRLSFLEGKARRKLFDREPPKTIYVFSGRITCAKNGRFDLYTSTAMAHAWFVWQKGYSGKPTVQWIN